MINGSRILTAFYVWSCPIIGWDCRLDKQSQILGRTMDTKKVLLEELLENLNTGKITLKMAAETAYQYGFIAGIKESRNIMRRALK